MSSCLQMQRHCVSRLEPGFHDLGQREQHRWAGWEMGQARQHPKAFAVVAVGQALQTMIGSSRVGARLCGVCVVQVMSCVQLDIISSCGLLMGYGPQAAVHNSQWTPAIVVCVCLVSHVTACLSVHT